MSTSLVGRKIGLYTVIALLGQGGMASVYKARQESVERDVALKVINPALVAKVEFLKRFRREARASAALDHPNIVKLIDYGESAELVYLVMHLMTGGSLQQMMERGQIPLDRVLRIAEQLADALDYAHEQGMIHRDIKPSNILFDGHGNVQLTDFGIAKLVERDVTSLTEAGTVMGTPTYMSPEQWQGATLDGRSDNYSFGIILYEMLAGHAPFRADTPFRIMEMHLSEPPPPIHLYRVELPSDVTAVLERALAKSPDDRYATATDMANALRSALRQGTAALPQSLSVPRSLSSASEMSDRSTTTNTVSVAGNGNGHNHNGQGSGTRVFNSDGSLRSRVSRRPAPEVPVIFAPEGQSPYPEDAPKRRVSPPLVIAAALVSIIAVALILVATRGGESTTPTPIRTSENTIAAVLPTDLPVLTSTATVTPTLTLTLILPSPTAIPADAITAANAVSTATQLAIETIQAQQTLAAYTLTSVPSSTNTPIPIPSATFTPTLDEQATLNAALAATQTALVVALTEIANSFTATPLPTETALPSATKVPTNTSSATITATTPPTQLPTNTFTAIPPTITPSVTASFTLAPSSTPIPAITFTPLPTRTPMTITQRAVKFGTDAPRSVGPLRLDTRSVKSDQDGTTLVYVTTEGLIYIVTVQISTTPAHAKSRFEYSVSVLSGAQQVLNLGDRAVIAPPISANLFIAALLYKDMDLLVYNPRYGSTVPARHMTQDEVLKLLEALYAALPVQ
ncbi:MAG: serine/threonine protein kinase [Anaerolineae bacterium]|nr:serine/threonine protein kinase [Anaerolineae bacterium]